jgi:tetratricopeptide (TPR) repeat protein
MSTRCRSIAAGLLALSMHQAVTAQDDAIQLLVQQGQYWQSQNNLVRADEAWLKILRIDPKQPDALYGLGVTALGTGKIAASQKYLDQLKAIAPDSLLVARLQQAITLSQGEAKKRLDDARVAAQSGDLNTAIDNYRGALTGIPTPQGQVALEYYERLSYQPANQAEAVAGLQRLAKDTPNNMEVQLALAQAMTLNQDTRPAGLQRLQALSQRSDIGGAALERWRAGLTFFGEAPPRSTAPLFEAYLKAHPEDDDIKKLYENIGKAPTGAPPPPSADPLRLRNDAGFRALDRSDLAAAEADFSAVLRSRPTDVDALGGMGVLRMRQQNFGQAESLLARAVAQKGGARWKQALNSASTAALLARAESARGKGDAQGARAMLQQALKLDSDNPAAQNALAAMAADAGQLDEAETGFRRVLARHPENAEAMRGLVGAMAENGKITQAQALIDGLTPAQTAAQGDLSRLRANLATGSAHAAAKRGDVAGQQAALETAIRNDPKNPWIRADLARIYMKKGADADAKRIMSELVAQNPGNAEALYASALISSDTKDWTGALATLSRIPENERSSEMALLERRVWVHSQADLATKLAKRGRRQEALYTLSQTLPYAEQDPEMLGALATAYVDAGDSGTAMSMFRGLVGNGVPARPAVQMQYASVLLRTGQDAELMNVLRGLQGEKLTRSEQASFDDLRVLYIVRQAEALRQRGDLVAAYDVLAPVLAERPQDVIAVGSLARMYAAAGSYDRALDLFKQLQRSDPDNLDVQMGAAQMASQAKDYDYAEISMDRAMALAPDSPDVLAAAARIYREEGKTTKAAELLKLAVAAQRSGGGGATYQDNTVASAAPNGVNPFIGIPGQRSQSTMVASLVPVPMPQALGGTGRTEGYLPPPVAASGGRARAAAPAYANAALPQPVYGQPGAYAPAQPQYAAYAPGAYPPPGYAPPGYAPPGYAPPGYPPTAYAQAGYPPSGYAQPQGAYPPGAYPPPGYAQPPQGAYPPGAYPPPGYPQPPQGAYAQAGSPFLPGAGAPAPDAYGNPSPSALQEELNQLLATRTPSLQAGVTVRTRKGESGTSDLTDVQAPSEFRYPMADGMLAVRVTPTRLDAGNVSSANGGSSRFGGGPVAAAQQAAGLVGSPGKQRASGVGFSVGYETDHVAVDIGSTPTNFRYATPVGGVKVTGLIGDTAGLTYQAEISRRPVTDSVLSFAGARDDRTGQTWGGVTANGGRLQLGQDYGTYGFYAYGGAASLIGHNVETNSRLSGGAGWYQHLLRDTNRELTSGLNFTVLSYDKNLRNFTYGQGGYFSPQQFYALSVPLIWSQRGDNFSYQFKGSVGVQHFKEDSSDYFPNSGSAQRAANAALALTNPGSSARYDGQTKTGIGYNLGAAGELKVGPRVSVGGSLSLDNASDYRQWIGGVYARYTFDAVSGPPPLPVEPFRSPYSQ